jgi:hypothetical protein
MREREIEISFGNPKMPPSSNRHKLGDNNEICVQEVECRCVNCVQRTQDRIKWQILRNKVTKF